MTRAEARLLELAEAIADGRSVDWDAASSATPPADRDVIAHLRLLAGVAQVHRSSAIETEALADGPGPAAAVEPLERCWGPLEIREWVGAGTYGAVYRAWDLQLQREVALKLHPRRGAADPSSSIEEGRRLARVRHPHVITVHGADEAGGRVGIWMEFIRGRTLERVLAESGPLGAREAALIGIDLCGALAAVHGAGLLHRDVKAQNVMREDGGRIVLMDFGAGEDVAIVRQRAVGTPLYMAPELLAGGPASAQTDIYALGVLLFRLVTGDYPVRGRTSDDVRSAHRDGLRHRLRDTRPDLPGAFVAAIECAIDPLPSSRFATAGAFEAALARTLTATKRPAPPRRVRALQVAAALLSLLALAGLWTMRTVFAPPPVTATPSTAITSIAVLPFTSLSSDASQQYFADGIADLILSRLAETHAIRIVSRTSSSRFRNASVSLPDVGSALNADAIVEGTVQRNDQRVVVTARLIRAASDTLLWTRTYERSLHDALTIEREIARDIAGALGVRLSETGESRLNARHQAAPEAQDAYLQARVLLYTVARPALEQARALLERAVAIDGDYDLAHAALARCYLALQNVGALTPADGAALARRAAARALALDPGSSEALTSLAQVRFNFDWDWSGGGEAFRRALDANPSNSGARNRYARYLGAAGRTEEAIEQARLGIELDPLSAEMHDCLALCLYWARRPAEALAVLRRESPAPPGTGAGNAILGRLYAALGRTDEALAEMRAAYERTHDRAMLAEIGRLHAVAGRRGEARRVLARLLAQRDASDAYVFPEDVAYVYVALGEYDEAIAWLRRSVDERSPRVLWLRVEPRVDALRSRPEFVQLLATIGP